MKNILLSLVGLLAFGAYAQTDSAIIHQIYSDFETTVQSKDGAAHLELYADTRAFVGIVRKNPTGPSILAYSTAQNFVNGWGGGPYELRISDIHLHAEAAFAITDAQFDEYINSNRSAYGRDLFGYVKTELGWKLLFLHNTAVFNWDNTDYSVPMALPNTVEDVMADFKSTYDLHATQFVDLFFRMDAQVISFEDELEGDYNYYDNELKDFIPAFLDSTDQYEINFDSLEIHYVDDYLASVFCNYTIHDDGVLIEQGRSYLNMLGTITDGWKITSWIRDRDPINATGFIEQPNRPDVKVYPNPVQNTATINLRGNKLSSWQVLNPFSGSLIYSGGSAEGDFNIDLEGLPAGIYVFRANYQGLKDSISIRMVKI